MITRIWKGLHGLIRNEVRQNQLQGGTNLMINICQKLNEQGKEGSEYNSLLLKFNRIRLILTVPIVIFIKSLLWSISHQEIKHYNCGIFSEDAVLYL